MWKKMDAVEVPPVRLRLEDIASCYYARDYVSNGGYAASEANNLISNLKKPVSKRGTNEWHYKTKAIHKFACELGSWLGSDPANQFCIAAIPGSKRKDHPEHDPRLTMVLSSLRAMYPNAIVEEPIERNVSMEAAHTSEVRPTIDEVYDSLSWSGFQTTSEAIILLDDVITTGTSFKACQRLIAQNCPGCTVYGVFWARTIWPDLPAPTAVSLTNF